MPLNSALFALSDPTRRALLHELSGSERQAGELADLFPVSRPAVAKHLRVLKEAGLVRAEKVGRCQIYRLNPGGLQEVEQWMEQASAMWENALTSFKRHAEGRNKHAKHSSNRRGNDNA